jgi:hypothetical protein
MAGSGYLDSIEKAIDQNPIEVYLIREQILGSYQNPGSLYHFSRKVMLMHNRSKRQGSISRLPYRPSHGHGPDRRR